MREYQLAGKKTVVIGLARSGTAAARLLLTAGAEVIINDRCGESEISAELRLLENRERVRFVLGEHPAEIVTPETYLVVKNPGVPSDLPPLQRAAELGVPVICEVELASWYIEAPIFAITGTNGKTTTTALTGECFKLSGRRTFVAGNIGLPLSAIAAEVCADDVVVAELSSFQLEGVIHFRPKVSAILNITPDHLDRHGTFAAYRDAKAKIFANQERSDAVVLNADDAETLALARRSPAVTYFFSRRQEVEKGAFVRDGKVVLKDERGEAVVCAILEIAIPGPHNLENALAASLIAWLGGTSPAVIGRALRNFRGVPHRLEFVGSINGVDFVNDSKGTNPDASIKALQALPRPKVLIAGGYDKGASFTEFAESVSKYASYVVIIGQVAARLAEALRSAGFHCYDFASGMTEAVKKAYQAARPGDVVLLSPACASWDMFSNYEERGEQFRYAVQILEGGESDRTFKKT
ncbi:MAG: UDP-N-acetylmuramoylalanine--D-glutamate ligase [Syntrophomonadaceae bacterium]|nr:UDP-N-acetylmuramoylalanine--D-glutamate ligase [Bacillota bacterium]